MKQAAFTLMELLISLLIFSVSLLGVVQLILSSNHFIYQQYYRGIALLLINDYQNRQAVAASTTEWEQQVTASLPSASIAHNATTITICWKINGEHCLSS